MEKPGGWQKHRLQNEKGGKAQLRQRSERRLLTLGHHVSFFPTLSIKADRVGVTALHKSM